MADKSDLTTHNDQVSGILHTLVDTAAQVAAKDQDLMLDGEDIYSAPEKPAASSNETAVSTAPRNINFSQVGDAANVQRLTHQSANPSPQFNTRSSQQEETTVASTAESSTCNRVAGGLITGQPPAPSVRSYELTPQLEADFENGYDSDGDSAPPANVEGEQHVDEEDNIPVTPPAAAITPNPADTGTFVDIPSTEINKLKVPELRDEL